MPPKTSPISIETAQRLSAYNFAVFARYVRAARRMRWRTATGDRGTGHRSIFQTLVHILNVHEVWMIYIVQGRTKELQRLFLEPGRKPTDWKSFDAYSGRVWKGIDEYVTALVPPTLTHRVKAPWMPGTYTVGDAVLQTTFEQAHHLGEIIGIYWQGDRAPPEMTWIDVNRGRLR